ncbi:2-dehydropantoate 2-reductase [Desertibacillus haloalkaliphilus]|uniref:2-dehydropantoate 2-reductase n=1 Tax=Desertibacillus haloalkaliphilus TaxID=1328930 RepID=UPI001C265FA2|nr:2-dehydropantoate 2-reductase [Desertibacillus haloalkaliphilus]MBU8908006.1 2-dehydropantoate 2-reductase [Desertibacillus haloalkaliphilus]
MRVLVLGAGAVGGYFGGRLVEKGEDVTFLVRDKRKAQLDHHGLVINSIHGDVRLQPKTLLASEKEEPFDVILLATKAYHLDEAIKAVKPYVNSHSIILPLLNGIGHLQTLKEAFDHQQVIGGLCFIESTLNEKGEIVQTSGTHKLTYGEFSGEKTTRVQALETLFSTANATFELSDTIEQDLWHKYLFITTLSGMTTLMRSATGPILETEYGRDISKQLFAEVASIMRAVQAPLASEIEEKQFHLLTKQSYTMKASMLRDIEKHTPIEADHIQGYLLELARTYHVKAPLLEVVYTHLKAYEINRKNESK